MTCDEARKALEASIGKGGPLAMTRAERSAIVGHTKGCPWCYAFVMANAEAERRRRSARLTAEEEAIGAAITQAEAVALAIADAADPETSKG